MYGLIRRSLCVLAVAILAATPALAQTRVPNKGMNALGLSLGFALPDDELLENGLFMAVSGEHYLTPRLSIRGQFGGAFFDVVGNGLDGKVQPWHLTGNAVYNWEHGKWHPYAGGGIGFYKYRFGEGPNRASDSSFGVNLGGGIEYFFTRTDTITGDLTFHLVAGDAESFIFSYKPRYWTISGGYKKYF
ncbi:MAG TPA: outer membrane beta-barrel protein [Vicinamibacterales bacterium]|nr:outer membrane beta-barrel protein [Vicinamibacterales bacterium]